MTTALHTSALIAVMALVTMLLRFLPFLIFRGGHETPPYIVYLGRVLPQAVIGMLVIYCLRDVSVASAPFGLPELIAGAAVVLAQLLRRNPLISILSGTVLYMLLIHVFGTA